MAKKNIFIVLLFTVCLLKGSNPSECKKAKHITFVTVYELGIMSLLDPRSPGYKDTVERVMKLMRQRGDDSDLVMIPLLAFKTKESSKEERVSAQEVSTDSSLQQREKINTPTYYYKKNNAVPYSKHMQKNKQVHQPRKHNNGMRHNNRRNQ